MAEEPPIDSEHEAGQVEPSRRRHERVPTRGSVQACVKASPNHDLLDQEFDLEIIEISPSGLRLQISGALEADALDLLATIDGYPDPIFLRTSVRWREIDDDGCQQLGVEIDNSDASDIDTWCAFQREEWFSNQART